MIHVNLCPLCGLDNQCANLKQKNPCWCSKESFPQGLLDSIPEELARKACVCQRCLNDYRIKEARDGEVQQ